MSDDSIDPPDTVAVKCSRCGYNTWADKADPLLPAGPFLCAPCAMGEPVLHPERPN